MSVVCGPIHGQIAAHTGLETTCESGTSVQSVPETAAGEALPMELPVCPKHKEEWLQAWPKQTKLIHYNIKLFWTKREHPRSRIWHLWNPKEKKRSRGRRRQQKVNNSIPKPGTHPGEVCHRKGSRMHPWRARSTKAQKWVCEHQAFLKIHEPWHKMATYRNSGNKLDNNWANSYDLLREKFCI